MKKRTHLFTFTAFLLFFNAFLYHATAQAPIHDKKTIHLAREYFRVEEYGEAKTYYEKLVAEYPQNDNFKYYLGACYYKLGQPEKAIKLFSEASNKDSLTAANVEFTFYMARSFHLAHHFEDAILYYQQYLDKIKAGSGKQTFEHSAPEIELEISRCKIGIELQKTPQQIAIKNIGPVINTEYDEYMPVISLDEQEMMFTSRRPGTTGGLKDPFDQIYFEDVYTSTRTNAVWSAPKNLGGNVNTANHDATVCLSGDGKQLYIYRSSINHLGETLKGNIYLSEHKDTAWTVATALPAPINSDHWEPSGSISAQGNMFFFTSDRPRTEFPHRKDRDIYMVKKNADGTWGAAERLPFNTEYEEDGPFIHPDGKTLYFASNGVKSIGGFDLFKTVYNDSTNSWSEPENIGFPYNTASDDIYIVWSPDGKRAYFSSVRDDSYGGKDIYFAMQAGESSMALMIGNVYDIVTKKPVAAEVVLMDLAKNQVVGIQTSDAQTGKFSLAIPSGKNYAIIIDHDGYLFHSENIEMPALADFQEYRRDVFLTPFVAGSKEILKNVFFDTDKAVLKPESQTELNHLYDILSKKKNLHVQISGYTDDRAPHDYNHVLSEARASAVVKYLIDKGLDSTKISAKGFGETEPIADNATNEGRQLNRRVEYLILDMEDDAHSAYVNGSDSTVIKPGQPRYYALLSNFKEVYAADLDKKSPELNTYLPFNVHFSFGDSKTLTEYSTKRLNALADYMKQYPALKLTLTPHADYGQTAEKNLLICKERAKTVYNYLIKKGIKTDRLLFMTDTDLKAAIAQEIQSNTEKSGSLEFLVKSISK